LLGKRTTVSGVARNLAWGAVRQFWLKSLIDIEILYIKGTPLYPVLSSLGLGDANAPLHPLWLRY